ncbi:hypothetical protein DPEC_G00220330 [Dallia pectoralis]|uniref:Uncharacterized protein n=1 Tax=Dallia pectoralis TaxID=75939 RepID=A0ACC2G3V7_DALPE|nr:hypothetical protein DPEC_G00220330 [Dallia pectoralis]
MIGGFNRSFNSVRVCRHCMGTYTDIKEKFQEDSYILRTADVHRYHLECIQQNPDSRVTYGVQCSCPFNVLPYFDVTKSLPPDIMHDMLEGVIPLVLKLVLCQAHKEKHISIQEVNEELQRMTIGQNDRANKPVQLSERLLQKGGIVGSASQKWCLFRLLPFLIAHRIPPECQYWHVYLLCREIVDIVQAPTVRREKLPLLDVLVQEFLTDFKAVFGNVITPKCHYLINYSRLMTMFGPLRSLWCMRFEGKHQYFKNIASNCRNFINIASTLSNRHQLKQFWEFSSNNFLDDFEKVPRSSTSTPFCSLPLTLQCSLEQYFTDVSFSEDKVIQRVSEVTLNNVKYATQDVFVLDVLHGERIPLFFQVKYIFNVDTTWVLCRKLIFPKYFSQHFYAYSI